MSAVAGCRDMVASPGGSDAGSALAAVSSIAGAAAACSEGCCLRLARATPPAQGQTPALLPPPDVEQRGACMLPGNAPDQPVLRDAHHCFSKT